VEAFGLRRRDRCSSGEEKEGAAAARAVTEREREREREREEPVVGAGAGGLQSIDSLDVGEATSAAVDADLELMLSEHVTLVATPLLESLAAKGADVLGLFAAFLAQVTCEANLPGVGLAAEVADEGPLAGFGHRARGGGGGAHPLKQTRRADVNFPSVVRGSFRTLASVKSVGLCLSLVYVLSYDSRRTWSANYARGVTRQLQAHCVK
jgi:hypothetical protein